MSEYKRENSNPTFLQVVEDTLARAMQHSLVEPPLSLTDALGKDDLRTHRKFVSGLHSLSLPILEAMKVDSRFAFDHEKMFWTGNSAGPFYSTLASQTLRIAMETGSPEQAVDWLFKTMNTETAPGQIILCLRGLIVKEPIRLWDDLLIVPFESLRHSDMYKQVAATYSPRNFSLFDSTFQRKPFSAAFVLNTPGLLISGRPNRRDDNASNSFAVASNVLPQIALVLNLLSSSGVVTGPQWFEYEDRNLNIGGSFSYVIPEIAHDRNVEPSIIDGAQAAELVSAYFALPSKEISIVHIALERLQVAMRRYNVGDRAVEICIALEALLGDAKHNEMTHKVKVRGARLLGGPIAIRQRNAGLISMVYRARSALVHTGKLDPEKKETVCTEKLSNREIVDQAHALCIALTKKIILMGCIPDWPVFDLED